MDKDCVRTLSPAEEAQLKQSTAKLSIISNSFLFLMKITVGLSIGSVSIISEAIHSGMDLLASGIAYVSVRISSEPADSNHEFGHGKFEDVSGLIEATLIFIAALLIIYESLNKIMSGAHSELVGVMLYSGIAVMGISTVVNYFISKRLMRVAKQTCSIALESDAYHLRSDVYTSLGVFIGLIAIQITHLNMLDSIIALAVSFVILHAAYDLSKRSIQDLIDYSMPDEDKKKIQEIIEIHSDEFLGYHDLRTRRAGPDVFVTFHLKMSGEISVEKSHKLSEIIERDLRAEYPRCLTTIHIEPCIKSPACHRCGDKCRYNLRK